MATNPASAAPNEPTGDGDVESLIADARRQVEIKDNAGAVATLEKAMSAPGCSPAQRLDAASVFVAAGDKAKAVAACLDAGSNFLYDMGDMAKARAALAQAHQIDPSNLDVIFQMGQADVVEGRTQDALAKFIDVLRKSNLKHVPALFEAGCIYQANGQYDQAILAFKKVLDRDKSHVQAIVHMGQLHQTKGMLPESLSYYLQAADIARESGQFGTAAQLCNMVLALDGNNQKARFMIDDLNERNQEIADAATASAQAQAPAAAAHAPAPAAPAHAQPAPAVQAGAPASQHAAAPAASGAQAVVSPDVAKAVDDAKRALQALAVERAELQKELEALGGARLDAEHALAQAKDELEAAQAQAASSLATRSEVEGELSALTASVTRSRLQAEEAAKRKADIDAELVAATSALNQARRAESEITASAEKRRAEIENELSALAAKKAEAQAEAAGAGKALEAARAQLGSLDGELARLRSESAAAAAASAADASAATQAAATLRDLQGQVDAFRAAQQKAQAEADASAAHRDEVRAEIAALEKRLADGKAEAEAQLASLQDQVKSVAAGAADAKKLAQVSAKLKELEGASHTAAAKLKELETASKTAAANLAESNAAVDAAEARKHEVEEAYARSKSLAAAADEKRADAARAAEQAEALRKKREADADALGARIAALEVALKDADAKAKLLASENAELADVRAKLEEQRNAMQEAQAAQAAVQREREDARAELARVQQEVAQARQVLEDARVAAAAPAAPAMPIGGELRRRASDESYAEAVAATVPPQTCAEALRTIESLAAEGEIPFEIAAELAGLIHEGRAVEALRVSRARANLEAKPAPYLLAVGDLARDLGDAAGAREAYRTLAAADPSKTPVVHQRMGELFLTFADQGTAAALQRDDAHYAFAAEPAKALEAYAELVARFPNDATFRQELGEVHERLGNNAAAGLAYTQAVMQYLAGDDAAKAVELVPKLLAVRPESGDALELAARAYDRAGRAADAQHVLDEALRAYRNAKSAADVERVCRRLAEIADNPVPYRKELAALLREVGDIGGAAEQLVEAAERLVKWSNAADALVLLREAAGLAGDVEPLRERIASAKERAVEAQSSVDAAARAGMFLSKKQYDKAAEAYRAAVDKNPYNADACYQLACLLTDYFPDYPTAEQLLENAAEVRPGHTATRYRLALVKAARGEVVEAVELLIALARFDENNADFIDQFVERLEKDAESGTPAAKYRLGIAYRELGRVEEALVILQSIQRESEFIVLCLNAIGLCLRRQGLDTAAAKRFQKAIETPGYPENQYNEALYNLGDLYEAKRDPESLALSLSSFEELYARDCTFRDVADRIKAVKSKLGAAEGPKVKRLPNRSEAANDR